MQARRRSGTAAAPRFWRDPALPHAESRQASDCRACYRPHTHQDRLSIGVVDAGASLFTATGHQVRLEAGALVVVPAGCVHACNPLPGQPWSYQMLYLHAAWAERTLACAGCAPLPAQALVVRSHAAYQAFCALNRLLFSLQAGSAAKDEALAHFLQGGAWREDATPVPVRTPHGPSTAQPIARVQALLRERHPETLPLTLLAEVAGMGQRALVPAFRAATGLTPHAWQLDARINAARTLLAAGSAPAAVAQDLGFYDQSHFHNAFRERVAATPGDYRR